jgi:hypothetical protein
LNIRIFLSLSINRWIFIWIIFGWVILIWEKRGRLFLGVEVGKVDLLGYKKIFI